MRNSDIPGVEVTKPRAEIVERLPTHASKEVEIKFLADANRAFLWCEIFRFQFASPALAPAFQAAEQLADIVGLFIDEDGRINGEARVTVEDDGQVANNRKINAAPREVGQQSFERGNNLLRG
jgi:hypothetical protein